MRQLNAEDVNEDVNYSTVMFTTSQNLCAGVVARNPARARYEEIDLT